MALCVIGAVAVLAFLEAQRVAAALNNVITPAKVGNVSGGMV